MVCVCEFSYGGCDGSGFIDCQDPSCPCDCGCSEYCVGCGACDDGFDDDDYLVVTA